MRPHHSAIVFVLAAAALAPRQAASQQSGKTLDSTIVGLERRGWEAIRRKDMAALFKITGPFLYVQPTSMSRFTAPAAGQTFDCETRSSAMDSITVTPVGDNGAVLTYRATLDQTCGGRQVPSPQYAMEVWTRRNGQWQVVSRSDTPVQAAARR